MAGGVNTDWAKLRIFQHLGRCDLEQNKADLIFCWLHRVLICCSNSKTVYLIPHRGFSVLLFIQCDMAVYDMMLWRGKCGVNLCIFQAEGEAVDLNCCSPHPCKNTFKRVAISVIHLTSAVILQDWKIRSENTCSTWNGHLGLSVKMGQPKIKS